jgi:predicted N-acetyltransferase YhbS
VSDAIAFALATPDDDPGIRHLLASNAVPGRISIRYEREPDYFAGCTTMGQTQVLVARAGGTVVGVACRALRPMYINGEPQTVGYLGQLRVDRAYRGRWLVAHGFRMLHELHREAPPRGYVTTIIEGSREAEGVLVKRARGSMPRYRRIDRLMTLALRSSARRPAARPAAEPRSLGEIVAFLNREGRRRNFFPMYDEESFSNGMTRGFDARDFVTVDRDGELAGVAGFWDQRGYKQSVVHGYEPMLRFARPFYNAAAALTQRPPLPAAGSSLATAYGSFFCVRGDDASVARNLIEQLLARARERSADHLLLGLLESDPLLTVAQRFAHIGYPAAVYTVAWDDDHDLHDQLDTRPRYLEIAAL